jgi:hypothetical protein
MATKTRAGKKKAGTRKGLAKKLGRKIARKMSALVLDTRTTKTIASKPLKPVRFSVQALAKAKTRAFRAQGSRELLTIKNAFQLSSPELGSIFGGVSRQAIDKWLEDGVPNDRVAEVSRVAQIAEELARLFKAQRLPAIVRGPMRGLDNRSILEVLSSEGSTPIYLLFRMLRELVPGAEPIRREATARR